MPTLESQFAPFRRRIIGHDLVIAGADGRPLPMVYADWIASGRLYQPIEDFMRLEIGPLVANTHTEATHSGTAMTRAYREARQIIRRHVNAGPDDSLLFAGFGMTAAVNKLQRLLGLRHPGCGMAGTRRTVQRPLVILTHMEHHSNQISWEDCDADTAILPRRECDGLPDLDALRRLTAANRGRPLLIGSFTAASNVTGILTPYHEMAAILHAAGGVCFVDFAAAAPYVAIDMHPPDPARALDAVFFSPHKFLGGPGSSGILVLSNRLYHNAVPDQPGGGTVKWTTPFGSHAYIDGIEAREDGGTPGFLQAIRAALAVRLKDEMGVGRMLARERELTAILFEELAAEPGILLFERHNMERLATFSLHTPGRHHNLIVRVLNDHFGIQTRGGCSCAGTYGHILFSIDEQTSHHITCLIDQGDLSAKPGWVRISLHPTMTDAEARFIGRAVVETVRHYDEFAAGYRFDPHTAEFEPLRPGPAPPPLLAGFKPLGPLSSAAAPPAGA